MIRLVCLFLLSTTAFGTARPLFDHCPTAVLFSEHMLTQARNTDLEKTLGKPQTSWAVAFPQFYDELLRLYRKLPDLTHLFPEGFTHGRPMGEIQDLIRIESNRALAQVRKATQEFERTFALKGNQKHYQLAKRVVNALLWHTNNCTAESTTEGWRARILWSEYQEDSAKWKEIPFTGTSEQLSMILNWGSRMRSFWGEVRTAFLLPNTFTMAITLESFSHSIGFPFRDTVAATHRHKEFDILSRQHAREIDNDQYRNKRIPWIVTEVKTLYYPLFSGASSAMLQDWAEALKSQELAFRHTEYFARFQIVLVNGFTAKAKEQLLAMGYRNVIGPLVELPGER